VKWKWLVAAPLLAFAAASIAALVVNEVWPKRKPATEAEGPHEGVSVFFFHGEKRCENCIGFEAVARKAVEGAFAGKRLQWRTVNYVTANYRTPDGRDFREACDIYASCIVAVEFRDGKAQSWRKLAQVSDYLESAEQAVQTVQDGVGAILKGVEATAQAQALPQGLLLAALSALWLGILTSISPCPLATNIAAISYIGRRVGSPRQVLLSGLLYTAGRTLAYVAVAALIVGGLLYKADVAAVLSRYMNRFLGPILILVGIVLLRLVELSFRGFAPGEGTQRRVEAMGAWGAGLLGILFALAFCPVSAALFFGSLITLALQSQSSVLLPTLYGVGTAVPVVAVALVLAFSAQSVGKVFHRLTQFELWARWATGALFVLIGGYFCLAYIYGVL